LRHQKYLTGTLNHQPAAALLHGERLDLLGAITPTAPVPAKREVPPEPGAPNNGLIESWREIIKIRDTLPDETPGSAEAELPI
jgi:hypothetical protein